MCAYVGKRMTARAFVQLIGYWFGRLHLSASVGLSNDGFFDGNISPTNALAFFSAVFMQFHAAQICCTFRPCTCATKHFSGLLFTFKFCIFFFGNNCRNINVDA